ncbi:MAG TPA: TatD family hydrolase [Methanocorpusculum sp.]|nr:TatD family hydrolase [Methanocorpusculum sp.]HJJ40090.1 TatD family hydrolase [Methanocorpusculum sp.]HJJ49001.1 TatD family hydrolase [Methanocorpusculum sp.]HJJ57245.1 TatD family hydrolase [Methanocorpusculum sp.]HJJ95197.1 TatD family hydrolase [Methanocorpusculum sp.]
MTQNFPILDDHFHINRRTGKGPEVIKEFMRSGGTHIVLVALPSWSCGVTPVTGDDFRAVYDTTIADGKAVQELGCHCYTLGGVHPAEIGRLLERMSISDAEELMKAGLDVAAEYVSEGKFIGLKSGRPHYPVSSEIWDMSNRVLMHAIELAKDLGCPLQIHAESGSCADVGDMAASVGLPLHAIIKHFATCDTPLHPSVTAREPFLGEWFAEKRDFTMESDYMDDNSRPGAVNGPRSVPRTMQRMLQTGQVNPDDMWHVHAEVPSKIYHVPFDL